MNNPTVDPALYREAMARYAGHVQIVTVSHQGEMRGVTVTAACSVSDDPGTVMVCVAKDNPLNRIFAQAGTFALNSLSAHHQPLADIFSGLVPMEGSQRFEQGDWDTMSTGAPTLADAAAVYDCRLIEAKEVATHLVLFGQVEMIRLGQPDQALVYMNRAYHQL